MHLVKGGGRRVDGINSFRITISIADSLSSEAGDDFSIRVEAPMKRLIILLAALFFGFGIIGTAHAQVPIAYYDFENNATRTTFENAVEQQVNTGNSTFTRVGLSNATNGAAGAGTALHTTTGATAGEAINSTTWPTGSTDPGTGATNYYQFTVSTSGFTSTSLSFDVFAGTTTASFPFVGALISTNGGSTFSSLIIGFNPSNNTWSTRSVNLPAGADNNSNVVIRIYGYNSDNTANGVMRLDNVTILATTATTGTETLLDESSIFTSVTSGATGSVFIRTNFTVNGASVTTFASGVSLFAEAFSGTVAITSGTFTLAGPITESGSITVSNGATFSCGAADNVIQGAGSFTLSSGATLQITDPNGLTSTANAGSVQVTGTRTFSASANYVYTRNASGSQSTGNQLPATITTPGSLKVNLGASADTPLTLTQTTSAITLDITGGTLDVGSGITLTIASGGTGTVRNAGRLRNAGAVTTTGALTFNSGAKYQHNFTTTAGTIPTATWNSGSTCEIIGYTSNSSLTGGLGQSFSNFTWNCPGQTGNINFSGNLTTINGNFTIAETNTGQIRLSGNSAYTLAVGGDFIVSGGSIDLTSGSTAGVTLAVNLSGNYNQTGGTLICMNTASFPTIGFTGGTASVTFTQSAGTLTTTNINWQIANGKTLTLNNAFTIAASRSMTIASGGTLTASAGITNNGTITDNGTWDMGANQVTATAAGSAIVINSAFKTANTNGFSGSTLTTISSTNTPAITLGSSSTIEYNATGSQSVTARTDYANLAISGNRGGGTITLPAATVGLSGVLSITATNASYVRTSNVIEFNGSGPQIIPAFDYNDLKSSNSGSRTLVNGGTIGVLGAFTPGINTYTITGNTIDFKSSTAQTVAVFNYNNLTISGARTTNNVTLANGNIGVAGNFNLSASFTSGSLNPGSSTLLFNGSSSQQYTNSPGSPFNNVTVSNSAGLSLNSDMTLGTGGVLNLGSGIIDARTNSKTVSVTNTATSAVTRTSGYIDGKLQWSLPIIGAMTSYVFPVGTTNGYSPVQIDITATAGATTFTASATQQAMPGVVTPSATLQRYWTLTTPGTVTSKLKFFYLAGDVSGGEAAYRIFKNTNGSAPFVFPDGNADDVDETTHTATTINNVTSYSDWSAGEPGAPTAVEMMDFTALSDAQGNVLLQWQTGYEVSNIGFNVYRDATGRREKLNPTILAGSVPLAGRTLITAGLNYVWTDKLASAKDYAQYWLEDVDLSGKTMWHGPISAVPVTKLPDRAQSLMLSQLHTNASNADAQRFLRPPVAAAGKATPLQPSPLNLQAQWDIAAKPGAKLMVRKAGWYRVTQPELLAAGFDVSKDPRNLQLFTEAREVPIQVNGGLKGRLEPGDSIEFYATGANTPWTNSRAYYLVNGAQPGRRVNLLPPANANESRRQSFFATLERRDRFLYFPSLNNGDAENWFGAFISSTPFSQSLALQKLDQDATDDALLEVAVQGLGAANPPTSHIVRVQVNGQDAGALVFDGPLHQVNQFSVSHRLLLEGSNSITLTAIGGSSDFSVVDWLKLSYAHRFVAEQNRLLLSATAGEAVQVEGFTTAAVRVFDVTDEANPVELSSPVEAVGKSYRVTIVAQEAGERVLLAVGEKAYGQAAQVVAQVATSWHQPSQGADVVMITHGSLRSALEPLVQMRKGQGYAVAVVDIEDVYDEYSYGQATPQAIQDFLAQARNWKRVPKYVLLVGDASYDPKNYVGLGENDLVPTKAVWTNTFEAASDDWLADMNGDGIADFAIGRLPVRTAAQAQTVVSKIVSYEQAVRTEGALLVADLAEEYDFEAASLAVEQTLPAGMAAQEIYRSRMDDATASKAILDAINRGPKLVNYAGHGSSSLWRGNLLTTDSVGQLTNQQALPMVISMTCLNGLFNDPRASSLGETLLLSERGGAIAVWASSAQTTAGGQAVMNQEFIRQLFNGTDAKGQSLTLGEAAARAKAAVGDIDIRKSWILLGDPTMRIK
jgi:hypothetical protein